MRSQILNFALLILGLTSAVNAAGPTGLLNDTGQTQCLNAAGTALEACSQANSGDASSRPRQDGRFGRDPAAANPAASGFTKPAGSGGSGGFAFIPLKADGTAITGNPPFPAPDPANAASLRCIHDTVTNLIWEVKTDTVPNGDLQDKDWTYAWGSNTNPGSLCFTGSTNCNTANYITALNAANVCPVSGAGAWRLPSRRELLSIVEHQALNPAINGGYFPNTMSKSYWSADVYPPDQNRVWNVDFLNGFTYGFVGPGLVSDSIYIRLVRSGP
jgi:hypothetical protein